MPHDRKLAVPSMKEYMKNLREETANPSGVNAQAHEHLHGPAHITWTSKATLAVETGTPLYFPRGGQIIKVTGGLKTAGSSTTSIDLLLDGTAVTDATIDFLSSEVQSKPRIIVRPDFDETTKFVFSITAVGTGAGGPITLVIEYLPEF